MPKRKRAEILFDRGFRGLVSAAVLRRAVELALDAEHTAGPDQVSLLITGDDRLRALHKEFMGEDSVTDVLSFNETPGWKNGMPPPELGGPAGMDGHFAMIDDESARLGDIVISLHQAERQANAAGHGLEQEVAMLAVHGVLHLLGYDHATGAEERVMFGKTDRILEQVFAK